MSTATSPRRGRADRLLHLIVGVVIVVALVLEPPALPHFGPSLATPLTTSTLSRSALLLAWIVLLVLALALLQRALAPKRTLLVPAWATRSRRTPTRVTSLVRADALPAPRLLVARHPTASSDSPVGGVEQRDGVASETRVVATIGLLGPVTIDGVRRPRRATTVELLAYLALHPGGASRDELLEAMWPEEDPRRTRPRLWQSVSEARRLLNDAFQRDGEHYRLAHTRIRTDTAGVAGLLDQADLAENPDAARRLLERALALWRGDPLEGSDYAWADGHIRQLATEHVSLLKRVARARITAGDARGALRAAERGLAHDSLDEAFLRLVLEAEAALGRRGALTERYEAFCRRLDEQLGLEPHRETRLLYRQLLSQE